MVTNQLTKGEQSNKVVFAGYHLKQKEKNKSCPGHLKNLEKFYWDKVFCRLSQEHHQ